MGGRDGCHVGRSDRHLGGKGQGGAGRRGDALQGARGDECDGRIVHQRRGSGEHGPLLVQRCLGAGHRRQRDQRAVGAQLAQLPLSRPPGRRAAAQRHLEQLMIPLHARSFRCPPVALHRQRGMVLMVVLAVMSLMFLAGIGVLRATDTSNVIAGNFSFQQAALQASDRALTDALNTLSGLVAGGGGNTNVSNRYLATQQTGLDSRGIPTAITWADVSCVDPSGGAVTNCATDAGNYRIQYYIERMCSSNPDMSDINDIRAKCEYEPSTTALTAASIALRYRVLIRVRGPRGTEEWFEAMVAGPAST